MNFIFRKVDRTSKFTFYTFPIKTFKTIRSWEIIKAIVQKKLNA